MRLVIFVISLLSITACNKSSTSSDSSIPAFTLSCDLSVNYTPIADPIQSASTNGNATITVIALHGKNGSPTESALTSLKTDLNAAGYNVVMPYMPWSGLNWNGTLCDGISYVNQIIKTERANSTNKILLLGHSLGAVIVLAYAALNDTSKPDNLIVVAPGHFLHASSLLQNDFASSVSQAKSMISKGQSRSLATFQTYNLGQMVNITSTPLIYLSFHDTAEFPDVMSSINEIKTPTLWLAGTSDSLTNSAKNLGIIDVVKTNKNISYKEVNGDHFTVLQNVPTEIQNLF